jgi:hypothetical protein
LLTLAYCSFLLFILWFAVCGGSYLRDPLTIFSVFYLFFILWFPDPLHHLISQIIVDIGILFYLLFILWYPDPLYPLISQFDVEIGLLFY